MTTHEYGPDDELPRLGSARKGETDDELPRLGSLAQSARIKELNNARNMMFLAAALLVILSVVELATLRGQANQFIRQNPGKLPPNVNVQQFEDLIVLFGRIFAVGIMALGGIYVVFGFLVKKFPVPITIIGLCIYVVFNLVLAVLNPATLGQWWVLKLIIIVGLAKGIQSAVVYQKEKRFEALGREYE